MAGPTIAEMQLRIDLQGLGKVKQLQDALERVGSRYITNQLNDQAKALLGIPTAAQKAADKLAATEARLKRTFGGRDILGGVAKFGIAAMTVKRSFDFIGDSVKGAIDPLRQFQSNLAQVRIKGGFTGAETSMIGEGIKSRVRAGSMFTPQQQAEAGVDLAASGLSAMSVNSMLPTVLRFAQGSGVSTLDSARILTNVANQFGIKTGNSAAMERLGDQIVKAANLSTISVPDIAATMKYVGAQANTLNMDPARILAMTAVLGNRGVAGSKGGTGMRNLFSQMARPHRSATAVKQLASIGMTQARLEAGMADPAALLQEIGVRAREHDLSSTKQLALVSSVFGQYGSTTADIMIKALRGDTAGAAIRKNISLGSHGQWVLNETNAVSDLEKQIRGATGAMKEAADVAGDTLEGRFAKLDARMNLLKITVGERFLPTIEKTIGRFDKIAAATERWVIANPQALEQMNRVADVLANSLLPALGTAFEVLAPRVLAFSQSVGDLADAWQGTVKGQTHAEVSDEDQKRAYEVFRSTFYRQHGTTPAQMDLDDEVDAVWRKMQRKQASAGSNKRIADRINDLGGASREVHEFGNRLTGAGTSTVNIRVGVDKRGELKAMIDRIAKGKDGPELRTESSVNL